MVCATGLSEIYLQCTLPVRLHPWMKKGVYLGIDHFYVHYSIIQDDIGITLNYKERWPHRTSLLIN